MKSNIKLIDDPFFLVYDSRSGSTFLANMLVKSVGVALPPESNFITAIFDNYFRQSVENSHDLEKIIKVIYSDRKFADWKIEETEIKQYIGDRYPLSIRDFILTVCTIYKNKNFPNSNIFGLKKGVYLTRHREMKQMFPQSQYIGIVRDGRAVFNSKKNSIYSVTGKPFETSPTEAAREWCKIINILEEAEQKYLGEVLKVKYEDTIERPEETVAILKDFLDIKNSSERINRKKYVIAQRYGELHKNVGKKPMRSRITAWQESLSAEEIYAFESVAYKHLLAEGYPLINSKFSLQYPHLNKVWQAVLSLSHKKA